ncbi:hypothetical protein BGX28_006886 [Mortierella sp. GBA30]|nr:hypothetical protein BGX28_006886 [Mortierella sp. GBA30]
MRYVILFAACIALVHTAPLISLTSDITVGGLIADSYIVVLKDGHSFSDYISKFNTISATYNGPGVKPQIIREYMNIGGFHAAFNKDALNEIRTSPEIAYIEQDAIVKITALQLKPPSWGLTRVSERDLDLTKPFVYNNAAGSGITAYIIDTGIYHEHADFQGRAKFGANFINGSSNTDENGHGTHVAGTVGGITYGVAKKVTLVSVKVLDVNGTGSTSGVVAGMDWVAGNATVGKSVINVSIGGGKSQAVDDAASRLFARNIPIIVAAGNDETVDACNISPAGTHTTFTVAASDRKDHTADFTSFGKCVNIFAPGVDINSAWIGDPHANISISGTSMAAPHVAGVAALYLSEGGSYTAQALYDKLNSTSTSNKIQGDLKGSPNTLVFSGVA